MARFMRARGCDGLRLAVARGRSTTSARSGRRSGTSSRSAASTASRWPTRRCPARRGSRARRSTTPSACSAASPATAVAIRHASESRAARRRGRGTSCARTRRRSARGWPRAASGRGDRVAAYLPNIPETIAAFLATASLGAVWSSAAPEFGSRSVIDRFAQIEPKVLLAIDGYRYGGKDFDRRAAVAAIAEEIGGRAGHARLPRRRRAGRTASSGDGPLEFEPVPFDHPLWVLYSSGTTGLPEGDRAGAGRDPARAPQEDVPAPRRAGGRPRVLVHDDGLDDVELPRLRAAHRRLDRALRRQPGHAVARPAVGPRRGDGDDHLRHERELHRRLHEGGRRAGRGPRPRAAARDRLDGLAAGARGLRAGSTSTSGATRGCSPPRAGPTCARRSSAAARCCPSTRASSSAARSAPTSTPSTRTATASSTRSASS